MNCGIYKITNTINNKVYVGSSINLKGREYKHFWMLEKGFHDNNYLQNSFDKYGKENFIFEIIDFCEHKQLISRENVRMAISNSLRGKKLNNGHNGSIRKTCYKHLFKIIN